MLWETTSCSNAAPLGLSHWLSHCGCGQAVLRRIATEAAWAEVTVAAASSTTEPQWADTVMQLMRITPEGVTMAQRFSHNQVSEPPDRERERES